MKKYFINFSQWKFEIKIFHFSLERCSPWLQNPEKKNKSELCNVLHIYTCSTWNISQNLLVQRREMFCCFRLQLVAFILCDESKKKSNKFFILFRNISKWAKKKKEVKNFGRSLNACYKHEIYVYKNTQFHLHCQTSPQTIMLPENSCFGLWRRFCYVRCIFFFILAI